MQYSKQFLLFTVFAFLLVGNISAQYQIGNDIIGEASGDYSGNSVCLNADGSIIAIGAFLNDGNGISSGHVRIYKEDAGTWNQLGLDINGEYAGDMSGISISLNSEGNIVAIGAHLNDGNGSDCGHVRVYQYISGNWIQLGNDIDGEAAGDYFGGSVSLNSDGLILAVGAQKNNGNGFHSGHVRVFEFISGLWIQLGNDIEGEAAEDEFGYGLCLSSDGLTFAAGAIYNRGVNGDCGHVRIYKFLSNQWVQIGYDIDGDGVGGYFGCSIELSSNGNTVAIGSKSHNFSGLSSGQVQVYNLIDGAWEQIGNNINGEQPYEQLGFSLSLNNEGTIIAIGGLSNNGIVKIFQNTSSAWNQIGSSILGNSAGDQAGWAVSLNSDGSVVAFGAPKNDDNGTDSGKVKVYSTGVSSSQAVPFAFLVSVLFFVLVGIKRYKSSSKQ